MQGRILIAGSVHGYHTYICQWQAEIDALPLFKCEFVEYDVLRGRHVYMCLVIHEFLDQIQCNSTIQYIWHCPVP